MTLVASYFVANVLMYVDHDSVGYNRTNNVFKLVNIMLRLPSGMFMSLYGATISNIGVHAKMTCRWLKEQGAAS